MNFITTVFKYAVLLLGAITISPNVAIAQANQSSVNQPHINQPMDFIDQPEGMINCIVTGTPNTTPWNHRFAYWISGFTHIDEQGNLASSSTTAHQDWLLTITNSRFPNAESHPLTHLDESQSANLGFSFPAVSLPEWEDLGRKPSSSPSITLSYSNSTHGLYVAIRNTESTETIRPMVQVIHYLSEDIAIISETAPCFVGPRPPSSFLPPKGYQLQMGMGTPYAASARTCS